MDQPVVVSRIVDGEREYLGAKSVLLTDAFDAATTLEEAVWFSVDDIEEVEATYGPDMIFEFFPAAIAREDQEYQAQLADLRG